MTRVLFIACAVVFASIPAALSIWFCRSLAGTRDAALIGATVFAVALTAAKVAMPSRFHGLPLTQLPAFRAVWLAIFALDACAVGGGMASLHEAFRGPLVKQNADRAAYEAQIKELRAAYTRTPAGRPAAVIETELKNARAAAGGCVSVKAANSDPCRVVSHLDAEHAAAKSRDDLRVKIDAATIKLNNTPAVSAYPEVARLAEYVRAAGYVLEDERAAVLVALLFLIVTDAGAIVLYGYATRREGAPLSFSASPAPAAHVSAPTLAPNAAPAVAPSHAPRTLSPEAAAVMRTLVGRGDRIKVSQRAAASTAGLSIRQYGEALSALQAAGRIRYDTGPAGTVVDVLN